MGVWRQGPGPGLVFQLDGKKKTSRKINFPRAMWLLYLPLMPGARIYPPSPAYVQIKALIPGALHDAIDLAGLAL